jgi:cyanophycinase
LSPAFALLGSGEFEPWSDEVDRWILEHSDTPDGPILILPTASAPEGDSVFARWGDMGMTHFTATGIRAEVVPLKSRADAEDPDVVAALETAAAAYFSGGNPLYLADTLGGTAFWETLLRRVEAGLVYAGCSAGISVLGELAPDSAAEDPASHDVWRPGLRIFPKVILAPHWDMLDTYVPGLSQFIMSAAPPDYRLLGVDEHTAVLGDGTTWTVAGLGHGRLLEDGVWREWPAGERFVAPLLRD